jgi:hypothetical protein
MTQAQLFALQPVNPSVQPKYTTVSSDVELHVFEDGSGAISNSSSNVSTLTPEQLGLFFKDMQSFMKKIAANPVLCAKVFPIGIPS